MSNTLRYGFPLAIIFVGVFGFAEVLAIPDTQPFASISTGFVVGIGLILLHISLPRRK